jgi:exopolysaccharide production protein ExoY
VAVTALIFLAPLLVVISCLLAGTSKGPIVYRHKRTGFRGKEFNCLKFRTMSANSERLLEIYLEQNLDARKEWEEKRKLTRDPRVTPFGALLRQTSLDELPQLFNVIRGDMSLVGPRPVPQHELDFYGSYSEFYLKTRPGLTGAWQVTGRSNTSYAERVALDVEYVCGWSFWVDMKILIRTVPAVTMARGSY